MDREELSCRARQEIRKRQDALLPRLGIDFARVTPHPGSSKKGSFFFQRDAVDSLLELIRQRLSGQANEIVRQADKVCQHRFDLLGHEDLDYGGTIDWHLDAVHRKRAPQKSFYKVRYLDFAEAGDSKITWELNRHQHFVTLAKAYRLTGDDRYADQVFRQWRHWREANPYPVGINWASSLEVAFRSISWLWTYYLLEGAPRLPNFRGEWLQGFALHGRHIERYLSTYFSPNTHLLGEGVALFFLGVLCPELESAERWKSLGWEMVLQESERQVRSDGFHFEQSTYYHVYALDMFLHTAVLAGLNGVEVPSSLETVLEGMLSALHLIGRGGAVPRFGDDDGGRWFDGRRNRSEHLMDPLATGAILFQRGEWKMSASGLREETIWLLGAEGVRQWDALEAAPASKHSAALEDSGLYLLTAGKPAVQLVVDAGQQGTQSGGHGHADALSVCLQGWGHALLIDPGTYEYTGENPDRDLFRGTAMHNTVRVDSLDQAETATPFSWQRLTQSKAERWIQGHSFDLLVASHDGYQRLGQPVKHRRWVVSLKNGMYLVRDVVEGEGKHQLDLAWHLAPELRQEEERIFRLKDRCEGLALLPAKADAWSEEVCKESWSPTYGQKRPMTVLRFRTLSAMPAEFAILLIALEEMQRGCGTFSQVGKREVDSPVGAYRYVGDGGEICFFFGKAGKPWKQDSFASDAEFVCWIGKTGTADGTLIQCNGSFTEIAGQPELRFGQGIPWCELVIEDGKRSVRSSNPEVVEEAERSRQEAPLLGVDG